MAQTVENMAENDKQILIEEIRQLMMDCGEDPSMVDRTLSEDNVNNSDITALSTLKVRYEKLKKDYEEVQRLQKEIDDINATPINKIMSEVEEGVNARLEKRFGVKLSKNYPPQD